MHDEESISGTTIHAVNNDPGNLQNSDPVNQSVNAQGYERLASLMAEFPSTAIFRQFNNLNTLNLLYYQAELLQLEADLLKASGDDRNSADRIRRLYFQSHFYLSRGKTAQGNLCREDMAQWNIVLRIRDVLQEYSE